MSPPHLGQAVVADGGSELVDELSGADADETVVIERFTGLSLFKVLEPRKRVVVEVVLLHEHLPRDAGLLECLGHGLPVDACLGLRVVHDHEVGVVHAQSVGSGEQVQPVGVGCGEGRLELKASARA
eukprot:CAMPEP_0175886684 /NCGR_PEP_ID=MMETSP0107_2-20121207/45763_1 /TAXON_ID=195067 ORGANISM="Goniomonas pacifica, Strain CCMP1869" /NCGR_SAMPLE_ID=MMETSP0107_2 /ASSEMBLY_ACC=CAM_ASM_000203 /LENGTH=126 /DNA_ID=CAMNT_0017207073 /DNA_START=241 /DNA_END=624 /DNA_ORIENTATION=+